MAHPVHLGFVNYWGYNVNYLHRMFGEGRDNLLRQLFATIKIHFINFLWNYGQKWKLLPGACIGITAFPK